MDASHSLWVFFALTFGIIALPGMDMAYIVGHAVQSGRRGGAMALSGIVVGGLVHVVLNLSGLSALLMVLPGAYRVLLVAGALYLAWIGVQMLRAAWATPPAETTAMPRTSTEPRRTAAAEDTSSRRIFVSGMLNCLLNPKAYAFMLAVFPAFLPSRDRSLPLQALWLTLIIAGNQIVVYGAVLLATLRASRRSTGRGAWHRWVAGAMGVALIALAAITLAGYGTAPTG